MATYATVAQLRAYVPASLQETDAELEALLVRCEREIDLSLPAVADDDATHKILVNDLSIYASGTLTRAVCAQAEYHLHMGEAFFVEGSSVPEGPDTNMGRVQPRIAPKAKYELIDGGFLFKTGTMTQTGGVTPETYTPGKPRRTV